MSTDAARELVDRHEAALSAGERRRRGAHYTPEGLARRLVELGVRALGRPPRLVCDPSCGAGAVLLAAAEHFAAAGVPPAEVVEDRLFGVDVDAGAVTAAREALAAWAVARGAPSGVTPRVVGADVLLDRPSRFAAGLQGRIDLVCGNPPFLGQLSSDTAFQPRLREDLARRWPELGAYTDASALHLLMALDLVGEGGVVALLQPQSVLGSRDAAAVRRAASTRAALVGLWATDRQLFPDASVQVCVPVLRVGGHQPSAPVELQWEDRPVVAGARPDDREGWAALLAALRGVPDGEPTVPTTPLGELAHLTAGFRDEFYALAACAREGPRGGPPLVSVGMIDPGELRWGRDARRVAGRRFRHPVADLARLTGDAPRVAGWVGRRLVPKVLVATQTRVVEAVADAAGAWVPLTPVISVEPRSAEPADLAVLAAALSAPVLSALLARQVAGTGLGGGALRPSATVLAGLPVPAGVAARRVLAAAWTEREEASDPCGEAAWCEFARRADAAYGVDDPDLRRWWWERHPVARRVARSGRALDRNGARAVVC